MIELAGYPAGMYLVRQFWRDKDYSVGDAIMLTQGAFSGAFYGLLSAELLGMDFDNPKWLLFPVAGVSLSTILMDQYIDGYNYSAGQGFISTLGTISGISFVAGLCVMTEINNEKVFSAAMIGGEINGFYLKKKIFRLETEKVFGSTDNKLSFMLTPSVHFERGNKRTIPGFSLIANF